MKQIECKECGELSTIEEWGKGQGVEVGCEDCGSHAAIKCPKCEEFIDLIFANELGEFF